MMWDELWVMQENTKCGYERIENNDALQMVLKETKGPETRG